MRPATRLCCFVVLCVVLFGLAIHHGGAVDHNTPQPSSEEVIDEYDAHVDERVLLFGDVTTVDGEGVTIRIDDSAGNEKDLEVDTVGQSVESDGLSVEPGGIIQVYGTLTADRTVTPENVVVVDENPAATTYKYVVSMVGIAGAVGVFLARWRLSVSALAFVPRRPRNTPSKPWGSER